MNQHSKLRREYGTGMELPSVNGENGAFKDEPEEDDDYGDDDDDGAEYGENGHY